VLTQIVSVLPPSLSGVGDYALCVARALRDGWSIGSRFLVCDPAWSGPPMVDGFPVERLAQRSATALCQALESLSAGASRSLEAMRVTALLQLSPYGFSRNGAPFWLLNGIRRWRVARPGSARLITYFHELYATSPPWRRAFWLSPSQRAVTRGIAQATDYAVTSLRRYASRLETWMPSSARSLHCLPVLSNVGEPVQLRPLPERSSRAVVWGSAVAKREIYGRHRSELETAVRALRISHVVDIGPVPEVYPGAIGGVPVTVHGILAADRVSGILADACMGVLWYHPDYLGKSGVFAAYSAHGLPTLCLASHPVKPSVADGLRCGTHYVISLTTERDAVPGKLESIADAARVWYAGHSGAGHAKAFAEMICGDEPRISSTAESSNVLQS
jgi:hypothetical protein